MTTTIELKRHRCNNPYIVRSGEKSGRSQNYLCNVRREHFISGLERTYRGTASYTAGMVKIMPVRGVGIRGVNAILNIRVKKALKTLTPAKYQIRPSRNHYDCLETDGFWTYAGRETNKVRLIYAYHRKAGG